MPLESVFYLSCLLSPTLCAALTELLGHCHVETYRVVNLLSWGCPMDLDTCFVPCVLVVGSLPDSHSHLTPAILCHYWPFSELAEFFSISLLSCPLSGLCVHWLTWKAGSSGARKPVPWAFSLPTLLLPGFLQYLLVHISSQSQLSKSPLKEQIFV